MTEQGLRNLIESVRIGTLTRRRFVETLAGLGIAAPFVTRPRVTASNLKLRAPLSGWDSDFWALQDWYRDT